MGMRETYEKFGGDFDDVLARLMTEDRIEKYFKVFLADTVIDDLKAAYEADDKEAMFLASHTLKGNSKTLGLTPLAESSVELTEALRAKDYSDIDNQTAAVLRDFEAIKAAAE